MIKKQLSLFLFLVMIAQLFIPTNANAYSYGDPTKEDVAETLKLISTALSNSDWDAALEAYKVRRSEISSHFGESIAVTLDQNFNVKQKNLVIQNYRYVLYLNLERRFDYTEKDINDYSKVKVLLGKAKGTFDVLKPYVESKIPNEINKLELAFDEALEAIGNPGLFGMGKKPVKPEEFKKQTSYILTTLKPIFPYTAYTPEQQEDQQKESETEKTSTTDTNTTEDSEVRDSNNKETSEKEQSETSVDQEETNSRETETNTAVEKEPAEKSIEEAQNNDVQGESTTETKNEQNTEETVTEDKETEGQNVSSNDEDKSEEVMTEGNETPEKEEEEKEESVIQTGDSGNGQVASAAADHAPMEQVNKTNPIFSIGIIVAVLALLTGGIWFARKRNFI